MKNVQGFLKPSIGEDYEGKVRNLYCKEKHKTFFLGQKLTVFYSDSEERIDGIDDGSIVWVIRLKVIKDKEFIMISDGNNVGWLSIENLIAA